MTNLERGVQRNVLPAALPMHVLDGCCSELHYGHFGSTSSQLLRCVGETGTASIRSHQPETPWTPNEVYTSKYSLSLPPYISDKDNTLCKLHKLFKAF